MDKKAGQESPQPSTVIKFGTMPNKNSTLSAIGRPELLAQAVQVPLKAENETKQSTVSHVVCAFVENHTSENAMTGFPLSRISPSPLPHSQSPSSSPMTDSQELVIDSEIESLSSQPSELQLQVQHAKILCSCSVATSQDQQGYTLCLCYYVCTMYSLLYVKILLFVLPTCFDAQTFIGLNELLYTSW